MLRLHSVICVCFCTILYSATRFYFSQAMFDQTLSKWAPADSAAADSGEVSKEALSSNRERTNRHLRTRDLVLENSETTALIVMLVITLTV